MSDIDIAMVADSLKVLDPKWPIREADIAIPFKKLIWAYKMIASKVGSSNETARIR